MANEFTAIIEREGEWYIFSAREKGQGSARQK